MYQFRYLSTGLICVRAIYDYLGNKFLINLIIGGNVIQGCSFSSSQSNLRS